MSTLSFLFLFFILNNVRKNKWASSFCFLFFFKKLVSFCSRGGGGRRKNKSSEFKILTCVSQLCVCCFSSTVLKCVETFWKCSASGSNVTGPHVHLKSAINIILLTPSDSWFPMASDICATFANCRAATEWHEFARKTPASQKRSCQNQ